MRRTVSGYITLSLMVVLTAASPCLAACKVERQTIGGQPAVVLENNLIKAVVAPTSGGRITDLIYKPTGKHLCAENSGLLIDRVWNYADKDIYNQWENTTYDYQISSGPDQASIDLTGRGKAGVSRWMIIHKRYTITAGSAAVRADYRFEIAHDAMSPMRVGMWWHNAALVRNEACTYYLPTDGKVQEIPYGAGAKGQFWWYQPDRGWLAVRGESGSGLALVMDYSRLMCFYQWLAGGPPALEWAFRSFEIKNGGSLDTTIWLVPFANLPNVAGACSKVVAGLEVKPKYPASARQVPINVALDAPQPLDCTVKLVAKTPSGAELPLADKQLSLRPDGTVGAVLKPAGQGLYVVSGTVTAAGKTVLEFQKPTVIGQSTAKYVLAAQGPRQGRAGERFEDKLASAGNAPPDLKLSDKIVTPHIPWAKPYYRGKTRALILNDFLVGRESVELAQRLDLDYVAPTISTKYTEGYTIGLFGRRVNLEQMRGYVRQALKRDYDVIVVGGLSGQAYSPDILAAIRSKVENGCGLVWIQPNKLPADFSAMLPLANLKPTSLPPLRWAATADHYLTRGLPWQALPPTGCSLYQANGDVLATAGGRPLLAVKQEGRGRIVCLGYNTSWQGPGSYSNGLTPWIRNAPSKFAYWEYYYSLLDRCVLWAAHREPQVALVSMAPSVAKPSQADTAGDTIKLRLANSGPARQAQLWSRVVDQFGQVEQESTRAVNVPAGDAALTIKLPAHLKSGLHLVDAILREKGQVLNWGSTSFTVVSPLTIDDMKTDRQMYAGGDTIDLDLTLSGLAGEPRDCTLAVTLTDALGRRIASLQQPVKVGDRAVHHLRLNVPEPLCNKGVIYAELRDANGPLCARETDVILMPKRFADRDWGVMTWTLWGNMAGAYSRDYLQQAACNQLRRLGIDTVQASAHWLIPEEQRSNVEAGFRLLEYGVGGGPLRLATKTQDGKPGFYEQQADYIKTHNKADLQRPVSLSDPQMRQQEAVKIRKIAAAVKQYRPVGYCIGDELSTTYYVTPFDYDFSPPALAAFRHWLQGQYGTLAALNREWETNFKTWDEVMPMTTLEVRGRGDYAPWADQRTFMEFSFADYISFVRKTLREVDPQARVGISGTQAAEAYGGYDWWRLSKTLDFIQAYDLRNTDDMHRSFGIVCLPWWGYASVNPQLSHTLWGRMFNLVRGGSYFVSTYMLKPDFTFTRSTQDGYNDLRDMLHGVARLLHSCQGRPPDVLIHYSEGSIHGAYIANNDDLFRNNRDGWVKAIADLGMQADFVSYAQIEQGALQHGARALILPYSQALSPKEVAAIKGFVSNGGFLIADARAGLMDEHCRTLASSPLDEVFGITTKVNPLAKQAGGTLTFTSDLGACRVKGLKVDGDAAEPSLRLNGGQALGKLGDTPLLIVHSYGKGKAVLLNTFLNNYPHRRDQGGGENTLKLVANALAWGGVTPPVRLTVNNSHHVRLTRFISGQATYLGLLRDTKDGACQVSLVLPAKSHVYDVRAHHYLGDTDHLTLSMGPGEAKVLALLPGQVTAVNIRTGAATYRPGSQVSFTLTPTASGAAVTRIFRVQVFGPDKQERTWYGQQLTGAGGTAQGGFRLALNDAPGVWQIVATDVATGISGQQSFTVSHE